MNIDITHIITWAGMAVGLIGVWFRNQYKIERLEEKHDEHKEDDDERHLELIRQKDALWEWVDAHQKDSAKTREEFQKEMSEFRGGMLVNGEQLKQMMGILIDIRDRLARLENDNNGRRESLR